MDSVVLDKCYLEGATRSEIESLSQRRKLVMSGSLFYELMDTSVNQRIRCFAKLPATENPVTLVDHVSALMQREHARQQPCGKPSENAISIRFRFNRALLDGSYELPPEAREAMESEQQDLNNDRLRLIELSESTESIFPGLLAGNDKQRRDLLQQAESRIADTDWALGFYSQLSSPDPNSPFPGAAIIGSEWAHFRWIQIQLLFSLDLFVRYQGKLRVTLSDGVLNRLEHDVHDAQALALGVLEGSLATRENKLARWFKLLRADGELIA